jgi:hypothetical protein
MEKMETLKVSVPVAAAVQPHPVNLLSSPSLKGLVVRQETQQVE